MRTTKSARDPSTRFLRAILRVDRLFLGQRHQAGIAARRSGVDAVIVVLVLVGAVIAVGALVGAVIVAVAELAQR